jgi:hypothetical protein
MATPSCLLWHLFTGKPGLIRRKPGNSCGKAGIIVKDEKQNVAAIAAEQNMSPSALFDIIKPASREMAAAGRAFPDGPDARIRHQDPA